MPYLANKPPGWEGEAPPLGEEVKGEFFVVRTTQEAFKTYDEFLSRSHAIRKRQWVCSYTKKGGLTYQEALAAEARVAANLTKVGGIGAGVWIAGRRA